MIFASKLFKLALVLFSALFFLVYLTVFYFYLNNFLIQHFFFSIFK
jgi:hypothetical protein